MRRASRGPEASVDFTVTLDRASTDTVTVDYRTSAGTATAGADYTETSGTVTFAPGETAKTIAVPIIDDDDEDGGETFSVTGGEVRKAKRKTQGSNQHWTITVEPDGWDDVSLVLPGGRVCNATGAVCTADNRQLSNSPSATVQGPAALSVADANAQEGTDATLDFAVSLDRVSTLTVTVDYATSDGTATAGDDYTATSGTLTFAPGDVAKTVSVPILDDLHDDDGETLTLTLSNASNARIARRDGDEGTIENSDPIPKAWLARFGRTVADHVGGCRRGAAQGVSGRRLAGDAGRAEDPARRRGEGRLRGTARRRPGKARDALAAFADRASGGGAEEGTGWARWGVPRRR